MAQQFPTRQELIDHITSSLRTIPEEEFITVHRELQLASTDALYRIAGGQSFTHGFPRCINDRS